MATAHYSPLPAAARIEDPVSYKEASALLARTGHGASPITVARWVRETNDQRARAGLEPLPVEREGRSDRVSWSAVLDLHFERTAAKLRCSSNWP